MSRPRALVLGATGVLGRPLVKKFAEAGYDVVGTGLTGRNFDEVKAAGGVPRQLDLLKKDDVQQTFQQVCPEVVVNVTSRLPQTIRAMFPARDFEEHNTLKLLSPQNIYDAAMQTKPKRLVCSSQYFCVEGQFINDTTLGASSSESLDRSALDAIGVKDSFPGQYSDVKIMERQGMPSTSLEVTAREIPLTDSGIPVFRTFNASCHRNERLHAKYTQGSSVILRLGYLYGPGTTFGEGGGIYKLASAGKLPIIGGGTAMWSFIHVNDAVDALFQAATMDGPIGHFNVVNGSSYAAYEWIIKYSFNCGAPHPPTKLHAGFMRWWAPHLAFLALYQRPAQYEGFPSAYSWQPKMPPFIEGDD
ncbi:hypothetical protein DIPPA_35806 [Diplonema papillatum]|nr:hypothetical protein DIPPA_35806 [Diplonema papillatum]